MEALVLLYSLLAVASVGMLIYVKTRKKSAN